jgi:hypothetical protein
MDENISDCHESMRICSTWLRNRLTERYVSIFQIKENWKLETYRSAHYVYVRTYRVVAPLECLKDNLIRDFRNEKQHQITGSLKYEVLTEVLFFPFMTFYKGECLLSY